MNKTIDTQNKPKTIIKSHKELLRIIKHSIKQYNEIRLKDLLILCKVDTYNFLAKKDIPTDPSTENIVVNYPVIVEGIECDEIIFNRLTFNKPVVFPITFESKIGRIAFYDCIFCNSTEDSLQINNVSCNKFDIIHCSSNANISLNIINCSEDFNIEQVEIDGSLEFRNFRLWPKKDTEFFLGGLISKDIRFFNCFFTKKTTINVNVGGSIIFECVNYDIEEIVDNSSKALRLGKICMSGTTISRQLIFTCCNIGTIDLINVTANSISEFDLHYNRLKNQAGTILRNGALQRNDDIAYNKYTADIYDNLLRSISARKLEQLGKRLKYADSTANTDNDKIKKITRKQIQKNRRWKIVEPFWLLFVNLFSEEGLLLWLNKYSNNYNRSWFRGICFTCAVALLSYFVLNYWGMQQQFFVIDFRFNGFGEVLVGFFSLLDVFNLIGDKPAFELTNLGKILMFLSKILIAYGEWQTIYAFYKYKK